MILSSIIDFQLSFKLAHDPSMLILDLYPDIHDHPILIYVGPSYVDIFVTEPCLKSLGDEAPEVLPSPEDEPCHLLWFQRDAPWSDYNVMTCIGRRKNHGKTVEK